MDDTYDLQTAFTPAQLAEMDLSDVTIDLSIDSWYAVFFYGYGDKLSRTHTGFPSSLRGRNGRVGAGAGGDECGEGKGIDTHAGRAVQ